MSNQNQLKPKFEDYDYADHSTDLIFLPSISDFLKVSAACTEYAHKLFLNSMFQLVTRESDICDLRWRDININDKQIWISDLDGYVTMTSQLSEGFQLLYHDINKKNFLKYSSVFSGKCFGSPKCRNDMMRDLCSSANVQYFPLSAIRPLAVWLLASNGTSTYDIQRMLLHEDVKTTNSFIHRLRFATNPMDSLLTSRFDFCLKYQDKYLEYDEIDDEIDM